MKGFWFTVFYQPLYNGLIFLLDVAPWLDAGIAVIVFTCIVKLILFPLSQLSVKTQIQMKKVEPELAAIREKYKDDRTEQAKKTMDLYRERGIRPFAGFFLVLIQLPIIFALYRIFYSAGLPSVNAESLYSFVSVPQNIDVFFLGFFDITKRSIILATVAAITQFAQIWLSVPPAQKTDTPSIQNDIARSMNFQMRYIFPVIVFIISYTISGAVAIYLATSSVFTIGQELYLRRKYKHR